MPISRSTGSAALIGLLLAGAFAAGLRGQRSDWPLSLWRNVRKALTSDGATAYFDSMLGSEVPPGEGRFDGTVVSQPSRTELIVNVDDPAGDGDLKFDDPLGDVPVGTVIHFIGVVEAYRSKPYRLTLEEVDAVGLPAKDRP